MFQSLEQRIEEEISNGLVSDVCFGAGLNEEARLFCSKSALALASPVFKRMLFAPQWAPADVVDGEHGASSCHGAASEGTGVFRPGQHIYVAVTDIEPEALRCVLRYVHNLDPQLTLENALHVYRAADKYHIDGLLSACIIFLDSHSDPENVEQMLRLFDISCRLGLDSYACRFLDHLGELSRLQTARTLGSDDFLALHVVSLKKLLSYDGLCVSEEPLWLALRRWAAVQAQEPLLADSCAEHEPKLQADSVTLGLTARGRCDEGKVPSVIETASASVSDDCQQLPGNECQDMVADAQCQRHWQNALQPLKHLIRFPTMDSSFFAREVAQTSVLESEEIVEIFCLLANKSTCLGGLAGSPRATWGAADRKSSSESRTKPVGKDGRACFRSEPRAPRIGWCAAPGPAGNAGASTIDDYQGSFGGLFGCAKPVADTSVTVVDGKAWSTCPWGPRIALGGPGSRFHFAFGTCAFSSGRHAWTVFWRPLDGINCDGRPSRTNRGGAAGIARESDVQITPSGGSVSDGFGNGGNPQTLTSSSGVAGPSASAAAFPRSSTGASSRPRATTANATGGAACGTSAYTNNAAVSASDASSYDPSAQFLDWPTCFVFGVKRDVMERRYVAWDPADADYKDFNGSIRFAIVLDFVEKRITYLADRGERRWTAALTHEGPIYPVIAASGPHWFHIQYGVHF